MNMNPLMLACMHGHEECPPPAPAVDFFKIIGKIIVTRHISTSNGGQGGTFSS